MFSTPQCCSFLSQTSLTINCHVHVEGEGSPTAVTLRVNQTDVSPAVTDLEQWKFGHCACVWLFLALHGNTSRRFPGDLGDCRVRIHTGNQCQGAELWNGCSGDNSDWR